MRTLLSIVLSPPGSSIRRVPRKSLSIVVFITSSVGSFKGALVTEVKKKRDALVFEEASSLGVLKSREPGLSLVLLPSRLTLSERGGLSSDLSLLSIVSSPPGSSIRRVPRESSSIVVFITSPVGSFKGALVTEVEKKRDALVFEEASGLGVLKSREPGLSLVLLPSRLTLSERGGSSSDLSPM